MSLILDALKKSEQERRRDKGPDLQTIHQPTTTRAPQRSNGLWWGAALVVVNVAVLAYWWQQRSAAPTAIAAAPLATAPAAAPAPQVAAVPAAQAPAPTQVPPAAQQQPAAIAPTAAATQVQPEYTNIVPGGGAAGAATTAADSQRIEEVDELSEDIRNNLPAMTFSFHVFSTNPQQRTIIINNRRMREGEEISAGLLLQQITEDGVILLFAQHRIHISVLSGW